MQLGFVESSLLPFIPSMASSCNSVCTIHFCYFIPAVQTPAYIMTMTVGYQSRGCPCLTARHLEVTEFLPRDQKLSFSLVEGSLPSVCRAKGCSSHWRVAEHGGCLFAWNVWIWFIQPLPLFSFLSSLKSICYYSATSSRHSAHSFHSFARRQEEDQRGQHQWKFPPNTYT
eukprot:TRINITY_DN4520_c0_g1_i1.p1 TRINITY_DN4520_c0_g1~~TRINITY_DN4520_c0_g1_i1.p1  ORF type:complete len:171 (-),score=16.15 TRINITY_DN4520_c0_g1_i1:216-728(-)